MRQIDITNIDLPDGSKTLVWCSHVLDDVPDDKKSLSEIFRVLAPGGYLILLVMIGGEVTLEDASIKSKADRLDKFLDENHVRLYGLDIKQRIEEIGFSCDVLSSTSLPTRDQRLYSLNSPYYREVFLCRKPEGV
jgi:ubiquinone/menaquinone biosynthesis C-methylase UbiE